MTHAIDLIEQARALGVELRAREGRIEARPAGALPAALRETLAVHRDDVLRALKEAPSRQCSSCRAIPAGASSDVNGEPWCGDCREAEHAAERRTSVVDHGRDLQAAWAGAVRELGELLGFPRLPYKPGHAIASGAYSWRRWVTQASVPDLQLALAALRPLVEACAASPRGAP